MLVVLAIIVVVTTIVVSSQGSFTSSLLLTNATYDVALTMRDTQVYGLGGRSVSSVANVGYGLHFAASTPSTYLLFADTYPGPSSSSCHPASDPTAPDAHPGDCMYESGQDGQVTSYQLGNGITISSFCAYAGGWNCSPSPLSTLDVTFTRPNATPIITTNGTYNPLTPITQACFNLTSPRGAVRSLYVSSAGSINTTGAACPPSP